MAHVAEWKHGEVEELVDLFTSKKVIGIAEIGGIPAPQMQHMRKNLRETASIRSAKNTLIYRALDAAEKKVNGLSGLRDAVSGQTAIIATDMNPFKLFSMIKATRTMAPAKGGEIAAYDIAVKAGDTAFKPGPVVGELQKAGFPAAIQGGTVVIKNDKVIVPIGEKIPVDVAQMLTRLEIYPVEKGITLHAVYEEGSIFRPDVLDIDIDEFMVKISQASNNSFNLAIESAWVNSLTIKPLLHKAYNHAITIALERNILTKETVKQLISKAHGNMLAIASNAKDAIDEDLKKKLT